MKKQFVSYEIALKLKELGFDEECFGRYEYKNSVKSDEIILQITHTTSQNVFSWQIASSPLWQQCIDWFRNKYNLLIDSPKLDVWNIGKWSVKITSLDKSIVLEEYVGQPYWRIYRCFRTYEEARKEAILKAIELCQKE